MFTDGDLSKTQNANRRWLKLVGGRAGVQGKSPEAPLPTVDF